MIVKVIDFGKDSGQQESRRLADLPDRVVGGDPQLPGAVMLQRVCPTWIRARASSNPQLQATLPPAWLHQTREG